MKKMIKEKMNLIKEIQNKNLKMKRRPPLINSMIMDEP
jgi:hypothetical protein